MSPAGVEETYTDAFGKRRTIEPAVREAVVATMGEVPDAPDAVAIVPPGASLPVPGEVTLEDGTSLGRLVVMPPDAPFGYHSLVADDGTERLLITGPGRCHLPDGLREWG